LVYLTVLSVTNLRCPELHYEELCDSYISLKFVMEIKDAGDKKMYMEFVAKVLRKPRWRCEDNVKDIWKIDCEGGR
jgi:hypothetical protein